MNADELYTMKTVKEDFESVLTNLEKACECLRESIADINNKIRAHEGKPVIGWAIVSYPSGPVWSVGYSRVAVLKGYYRDITEGGIPAEYGSNAGTRDSLYIMQATEQLIEHVNEFGGLIEWKIEDKTLELAVSRE